MLAHVDENGVLTDKRAYAVGKLPKYISGYNLPTVVSFSYSGPGTYTIDMQGDKYRFFIIKGRSREFTDTNIDTLGIWDVFDNRYVYSVTGSKYIYKSYTDMPIRVVNSNGGCGGELTLSYSGNILTLNISQVASYDCYGLMEITAI